MGLRGRLRKDFMFWSGCGCASAVLRPPPHRRTGLRERRTAMHAFHKAIIATILMLALQLVALSSWALA
jgi:hypothetical protein